MSNHYYVDVPLKAHVKKYADHHLGNTPDNASKKNRIGVLLYLSLDKTPPDWKPSPEHGALEIRVNRTKAPINTRGLVVTTKKAKLFEDMLDGMFMEELFYYMELQAAKNGMNKREAMRSFLQKYNITEQEMPLQTLIKRVYRAENARKTPSVL